MRRLGRSAAFQVLYGLDTVGHMDNNFIGIADSFDHLLPDLSPDSRRFATELCMGVLNNLEEIDDLLRHASDNWRPDRMNRVDRNIIRLAIYELIYTSETSSRVILNEAIELAKTYGSNESKSFVNGVLDRAVRILKSESPRT